MNSHIFQPPSPSYSLSGDGLAPGCRILQKGEFVFVLAGEESAPLALVWLHGNASDCGFESAAIALLAQELDAFVIGVEWPGYGPSSHVRPSVEGTNAASLCALEIAGARRILVAGRSLGTGPAALLASELTLRNHVDFGLVLWSPISSVAGVSAGVIGSFLSNFVPKRWDVLSDVSNLSCPVLVIAGTHDTLTPLSMAKEVFQACGSMKKVFHTVNKATHNDGYNFDELIHLMKDLALESTEELETSLSFSSKLSVPKLIASPPLSDMPSECKVVIVGAGPVGLFLGVSLIHLGMRTSDVVLLEKHPEYQRHHVLRLEKSSLKNVVSARLGKLMEPLVGVTKTSVLETTLSDEAARLGLRVFRPLFVQDEAHLPRARVVAAADGAKSQMRSLFLGGESGRETLQHVLDVRLETLSEKGVQKLSVPNLLQAMQLVNHVIEESVSRTKTESGATPMTVRLLITKNEFEVLREAGASLRAPLSLPENMNLLPETVQHTIRTWLLFRQSKSAEKYLSCRCTAIDLAIYHAEKVAERRVNQDRVLSVFAVGDAAFGVPFFRALNNGLLSASTLAPCIVEELLNNEDAKPETGSIKLRHSMVAIPTAKCDEDQNIGFFGRIAQSSLASFGVSQHLSELSSRGATEVLQDMVTPQIKDPVLRYGTFMTRLIDREFSVARAKRDGIAIVRLANKSMPSLFGKQKLEGDPFEK